MKSRYTLLFLVVAGLFGCKESNFVTTKDDQGKITEKYKVNENAQKHGPYEAFVDGVLSESATYQNGNLQGKRTIYYSNGKPEIVENYDKNQITGAYITYYEDGKISQEATYVNGIMQGSLKTYHKNGQLKETVTMVDNEENGPFKEYYDNGQLKWEGQFLNGDNEYGLLKNYNREGVLVKKMMCDSLGVCSTTWTLEKGEVTPKN